MVTLRNFALLAVAVALSAGAGNAQAGKGVKKNGQHELRGVVVAVQGGKGGGSFTIKTHAKKGGKGGANAAKAGGKGGKANKGGNTKTINFGAQTKFELVHNKQGRPASAAALRPGEHVSVKAGGNTAERVVIHIGKKSGKKKK
jgi:hypothetical protein